MEIKTIIIICF